MPKEPTVDKATYSTSKDGLSYATLECSMSNGAIKTLEFNISDPMPKEVYIEGETWETLIGMCRGMKHLMKGEIKKFKQPSMREALGIDESELDPSLPINMRDRFDLSDGLDELRQKNNICLDGQSTPRNKVKR